MSINKKAIPSKKTLNLMIIESSAVKFRRVLPVVLVGVAVIALFAKFGVADRLAAADRLEMEAAAAEEQMMALEVELEDYDAVALEYSRYFSEGLGLGTDMIPLDCMEVLKIVDSYVMNDLAVSSIHFEGDYVSLLFTGDELKRAAELMARLDALPQVAEATLYTTKTEEAMTAGSGVYMQLVITFQEVLE